MDNTGNFGGFSNGGIEGGNNPWNMPQENKPVETAPAEAVNPLTEQKTEEVATFEAPKENTAPVSFEEQFTAVTEELPKAPEAQPVKQDSGEFSYRESLEEDKAALEEAHEKDPDNANIIKHLAETEKYLAKVNEELSMIKEELKGGVHKIEGDPSSRAERFDTSVYNASVEQKMGQRMYGDDNSGLVSSRANNLNDNWRNME